MKSLLRPTLSSFLVAFFALVLLFLGLFAEVFESRTTEVDLAQIYANPVPVAELQHLKKLRITNKNGNFLLENSHPQGDLSGPWQLLEPQFLKVKDEVVTRIVDALNVIRVRNFHRYEPINLTSFSLDNPTLTLLFSTSESKNYEIKVGLINPIDNSAYMTLSSQNQIYQIDPIETALESYDLPQLVESRVLAINIESLSSMEVYGKKGLELKLLKRDDKWFDQNGILLAEAKVAKFIERISQLKSFSIMDNLTTEQREFMEKVVSTPLLTLKLITTQGLRNYLVGEVKENVPGMVIEKNKFFALSTEDKKSFILIDKEQLKVFSVRSAELK